MTNELAGEEVDRSNLLADRGAVADRGAIVYDIRSQESGEEEKTPEILKSSLPQMRRCPF